MPTLNCFKFLIDRVRPSSVLEPVEAPPCHLLRRMSRAPMFTLLTAGPVRVYTRKGYHPAPNQAAIFRES